MKNLLILWLLLHGINQLKAQDEVQPIKGYHQHDGFYLSMNLGPVFGNIADDASSYNHSNDFTLDFSGQGSVFDFKIGGAIRENLILHAAIISNSIVGPTLVSTNVQNSTTVKKSDTFSIGEVMYGVGVTRYFMPSNIFISGTVGLGRFTMMDSENKNNNIYTNKGLSMQFKLGKEWWVSKNWGLGVGLTYGRTNVTHGPYDGDTDHFTSNRLGILFNTTFN